MTTCSSRVRFLLIIIFSKGNNWEEFKSALSIKRTLDIQALSLSACSTVDGEQQDESCYLGLTISLPPSESDNNDCYAYLALSILIKSFPAFKSVTGSYRALAQVGSQSAVFQPQQVVATSNRGEGES